MTSSSNNIVEVVCRKVIQNNIEFLVGSIKASSLIQFVTVTHRAIVGFDEEGKPIYNNQIQRKPSTQRVNSIKEYLLNDKFATFPNNLLISVPSIVMSRDVKFDKECNTYTLYIDKERINITDKDKPLYLQIFDGQHRFRGIQEAIIECENRGEIEKAASFRDFEFVVSFFIDAEIDFQAMLFSVINRTPVKVTQDLVFDLFGLTEGDSPQKTALVVALELNGTKVTDSGEEAPFYRRIRLLAKKEKGFNSPLSQGMFVKEITKLICTTLQDAEVERFQPRDYFRTGGSSNTIFRKAYSEGKDYIILRTLMNYFTAVQSSFVDSYGNSNWSFDETNDNPLQRTIGFQALLKVLISLFPEGLKNKDLSVQFFEEKLKNVRRLDLVDSNGSSNYQYSSVGVNRLRDDILDLISF
jgi:DGQHR domain-containing protein